MKGKNYNFLMFSSLSMLSQDLTFLERASEASKAGFQFRKEDTTQSNGGSEPVPWGKEDAWTSKNVARWWAAGPYSWKGPAVERD